MSCLRPSLLYILHNRRLVSPERLKWALWYQYGRPWKASLTYSQVLIAFNDLSQFELRKLREIWGPDIDEEPIGQLLLDQDVIGLGELLQVQSQQLALPRTYLGGLLVDNGYTYRQEIEHALCRPLFKRPHVPIEQKAARFKALELMRGRLFMRGYFSLRDMARLELDLLEALPLSFKPLADLLVLNGDLPDHLVELMCVNPVPRSADPLLALLTCHGYPPDVLLPRLAKDMLPIDEDKNLAVLLVEKGMISRQRLSHLILEPYRTLLAEAASG